ncbi:hypothetical protein VNO77_15669 [Canavalia gladiata]|uniref:Uncharacterized protein n=1 Tax=Canavalia gladiata TaxID=3824 RepID=A0AAN9M4J8_CANGL
MLPGVVARSFVVYFFELSLRGDPWRQGELPLKYWVLLLKIQPAQQSYQSLKGGRLAYDKFSSCPIRGLTRGSKWEKWTTLVLDLTSQSYVVIMESFP